VRLSKVLQQLVWVFGKLGLVLGSWAGAGLGTFGASIGAEIDNLQFPLASGGGSSSCGCSH
jgi:hypothetical protein